MNILVATILCGLLYINSGAINYENNEVLDNQDYIIMVSKYSEYTIGTTIVEFLLINNSDNKFLYGEPSVVFKEIENNLFIPYLINPSATDILNVMMPRSSKSKTFEIVHKYGITSTGTFAIELILYVFPESKDNEPHTIRGKFSVV